LKVKIEEYALKAKQKEIKIKVTTNLEQDEIYGDLEKLQRVLDNIISNAITHTPCNGQIHIFVETRKDSLHYVIEDSGDGFSKEALIKATTPFYRGDYARSSSTGHSGLGLSIAKQLLGQMEGDLILSNGISGGAKVEFWHKIYEEV
jgi:signal transduction histidine kinase